MINNAFHFDTLVWDWPIALYLFVLGIASGLVLITLGLRQYLPAGEQRWFQGCAAIGAPLMVSGGLLVLVFHLTRPLYFWYVMIYYNPHSVMSLGVMLFQIFFLALALWWLQLGHAWLTARAARFSGMVARILVLLASIGRFIDGHVRLFRAILMLLAVLLGVYTGFLLSTLKGFPLLNNGLLPVLFLNSGLVSGLAVLSLCHALRPSTPVLASTTLLHRVEKILLGVEVLLLVAFFFGLYAGGGVKSQAVVAALTDFWGSVFWVGVVGLGIVLPLLMSLRHHNGRRSVITLSCLALLSVLLFRFFILYAGQMTIA